MPFRRSDYHPKWELISYLIRFVRAKGRCERCGVKNHAIIRRSKGHYTYAADEDLVTLARLREENAWGQWKALRYMKLTKVILTVAHIDRDRTNNRFWNLLALCQRCHLKHDMCQHVRNRKYGKYHDGAHQGRVFN